MPQGGLEALNTKDPLDILAYQYDIVCNGVELSSGAVRNHDMQIMVKAFEIAGYDEEVLKAKFGALYNAFQFGAPPHAGMAPGVDRMIMLLRNEENIREIIPFPMSGTAQDLMCGAPNEVTEQQTLGKFILRLGIRRHTDDCEVYKFTARHARRLSLARTLKLLGIWSPKGSRSNSLSADGSKAPCLRTYKTSPPALRQPIPD